MEAKRTDSRSSLSIVAALAIAAYSPMTQAAVPAGERTTLLNLYTSTNGATWLIDEGWNGSPGTECTWFGVTCDSADVHVTQIFLTQNNLTGALPDLGGLPSLQYVDLSSNQLAGSIPKLGTLTQLTYFNASNNRLSGPIPPLSSAVQLQFLDLSVNQLSGNMPALNGLGQLQYFDVSQNRLVGSVPTLSGLTQLQAFYSTSNQLSGSLPSLDGLGQLQYLGVSGNQITGVIPPLNGLTALKGFDVGNNQLTGVMPDLSGLSNLYFFFANNNYLSGSMPALTGLSSLYFLNVGSNQLNGNIPVLTGLQNLRRFDASNNQLSGSLPNLTGLSFLQTFKVSNNQLGGSLPSLAGLGNLLEIDVDSNAFSGDLPDASTTILAAWRSALCPNAFNHKADRIWDYATGVSPWYSACTNPMNLDQHGLTGSWYNSSTSGQGFVIETYPDLLSSGHGVLAGGWFTYGSHLNLPSELNWFTIQGEMSNASPYARLGIYRSAGGNFNAPPKADTYEVGNATFIFTDCNHAILHYAVSFNPYEFLESVIPLTRLDSNVTCAQQGDSGADASNYPLSGAWYDPNTSGQGLFFDINPTQQILFAAWYTFPPTGTPLYADTGQRWFTLQAPLVPGTNPINNIPIYTSGGGYFDNKNPVTTTQVGSANLSFMTCALLKLTYIFTGGEFIGQAGTINLQRVGPTPANCKL